MCYERRTVLHEFSKIHFENAIAPDQPHQATGKRRCKHQRSIARGVCRRNRDGGIVHRVAVILQGSAEMA